MAEIAVIATLDTKGAEADFLRKCLAGLGHRAVILDTGMLYEPSVRPDITRQEIIAMAGAGELEQLRPRGKAAMMEAMTRGLKAMLVKLYREKRIRGVLSIGGGQGTAMATAAMQQLPVGFPKVMVSTIACGSACFGDYVGNRDIVIIPSIVDICGLNQVTVPVFREACGAVAGMVEAAEAGGPEAAGTAATTGAPGGRERPAVVLTMAGVTTSCVMKVKEILERKGYETIVCHCNVVGAQVMDELAGEGKLGGVIDITPHDVGGMIYGGLMSSGPERFRQVYESGIPVLTLPGAVDFMLKGPEEQLSSELLARPHYRHTPFHTHVRASYEEMYRVGTWLAKRHNLCRGRNAVMIPLRGCSQQSAEGGLICDRESDLGFLQGVEDHREPSVGLELRDMHINDPAFVEEIVKVYEALAAAGGNTQA